MSNEETKKGKTKTFRIYFTERTIQDFEGKNLLDACYNSGYPASHFKNILKHEILTTSKNKGSDQR